MADGQESGGAILKGSSLEEAVGFGNVEEMSTQMNLMGLWEMASEETSVKQMMVLSTPSPEQ